MMSRTTDHEGSVSAPTRQQITDLVFKTFPDCVEIYLDEIISTSTQRRGELQIDIKPHRCWELRLYFQASNYRTFREPALAALAKRLHTNDQQ
jgi:hypothetical protein